MGQRLATSPARCCSPATGASTTAKAHSLGRSQAPGIAGAQRAARPIGGDAWAWIASAWGAGLHGRRRPQAGAAKRVAARPIGGAHGHRIASAWGSRPAWAKGWPPARQAAAARQPAPEGGAPEEIPSRPFPGKLATVRDAVNQRRARRIVQITGNLRKVVLIYVNDYFNSHNVKASPFCPHFVPVLSPQPFPCKPS